MSEIRDSSFLAALLKKKSTIKQTGSERGLKPVNTNALEQEVDRQVHQAIAGGDPIKGAGVTKSGAEE